MNGSHPGLQKLRAKFEWLFQEKLQPGLSTVRYFVHTISFDEKERPAHCELFRISQAELSAAKEYVVLLRKKAKIRPTRSP